MSISKQLVVENREPQGHSEKASVRKNKATGLSESIFRKGDGLEKVIKGPLSFYINPKDYDSQATSKYI